jgi:hypothetical protein
MTMLTHMPIPPKHIFTNVPKSKLLSLLVALSLNVWVLDFLNVERCTLHNDVGNRDNLADILYD